tara:strand:+ start:629 stop:1030 length:402 start_codon:yes stop_codon:yes gene_type:complete
VPLERVSQGFKDISMTFQVNPLTDDLIALNNANAIARSVRNIVLTNPGEKFFNEDFGTSISESLFENINTLTASTIKDQIKYAIQEYEPRVRFIRAEVSPDSDNNSFDVTIVYEIVGLDIDPQEISFVLQPTR